MTTRPPPRGGGRGGGGRRRAVVGKAAKKKEAAKDPNAPKPPQTAFMYFSKKRRPEIQAEAVANGGSLSFAELGRLVGEAWKAAADDERAAFEATAAADRERFALEKQAYDEELAARKAASKRKGGGSGGSRGGLLACEREGSSPGHKKAKKAAESRGTAAPKAAAAKVSPASRGSEGKGKKDGGGGEGLAQFPMEDTRLIQRELAHREMLLASGRSKPPAAGDAPPGPTHVYPPRGPAPAVLGPMRELPPATPLALRLAAPPAALGALLTLWESLNALGRTFRLAPLALPLAALEGALRCDEPLDYSPRDPADPALLRVVARDWEEGRGGAVAERRRRPPPAADVAVARRAPHAWCTLTSSCSTGTRRSTASSPRSRAASMRRWRRRCGCGSSAGSPRRWPRARRCAATSRCP